MPSTNLPYLFAAFAVVWVAFFVYAFFLSLRQREMEQEIQDLRQALEDREEREEP